MSVQAMSWVFEHSSAHLAARLVLLAIANHADKDGRNSWASVAQLASEARCSERQVQYALRELETTGEIVQTAISPRATHVYELPGMATLWGGADIAPAESAPVQDVHPAESAGRRIRPARVQTLHPGGEQTAPEPSLNHPRTVRKNTSVPEHPEARRLCELLSELMIVNGCKAPTISQTWLDEARRLLVLDKRPYIEAERVLRWCQGDDFWKANIQSMPTFRQKYDRLRLGAMRRTTRSDRPEAGRRSFELAQQMREGKA